MVISTTQIKLNARMKLYKNLTLSFLLITSIALAQKKTSKVTIAPKEVFVSELLAKMTLEEKIGQLNLPTSGDITTGQANSSNIAKKIEEGNVGGLFNIKSVQKIKEVQKSRRKKKRKKCIWKSHSDSVFIFFLSTFSYFS